MSKQLSITSGGPRRERETVREFIAKKREMFLVQMSLDIKRAEILKLHERAAMKERALRQSQIMLEQDVTRFDTFLQANDARAHKAMKEAEEKMKEKNAKVQELKKLQADIAAITSEIEKHKEAKYECQKYKRFLDALAPPDWVKQQQELKEKRKAERLAKKKQEQQEKETAAAYESDDTSSDDEIPVYFSEPAALLEQFSAMEAANLSYIQAAQESEMALEEVKEKFAEVKVKMDEKAESLNESIATLEQQVADERGRCAELRNVLSRRFGATEQQQLLQSLSKKISEVHAAAVDGGSLVVTDTSAPLKMLSYIEKRLETFLSILANHPDQDLVAALERWRETDRREKARTAKREISEIKQQKRMADSLRRAQEPVKKKIGKPIMARSPPLKREVKVIKRDYEQERREREQQLFFS